MMGSTFWGLFGRVRSRVAGSSSVGCERARCCLFVLFRAGETVVGIARRCVSGQPRVGCNGNDRPLGFDGQLAIALFAVTDLHAVFEVGFGFDYFVGAPVHQRVASAHWPTIRRRNGNASGNKVVMAMTAEWALV